MTDKEALKLALEALEWMVANDDTNEGDEPVERLGGQSWNEYNAYWLDGLNKARASITAIKQALAAPDMQAELEATNRQVEILSDALAESRREVAAKNEALKLALEVLESERDKYLDWSDEDGAPEDVYDAITAIKQALALDKMAESARELGLDYEPVLKDNSNYRYDPPVAEPVAILKGIDEYGPVVDWYRHWVTVPIGTKFYTTPPAAQRKPLTDKEELSNGLAMALHDAVLIRIGKDDEATRQAISRIDKLAAEYTSEAAHGIKE